MRRIVMLAAVSMVATLVLAPTALAQAQDNPYCPDGGFPAAPQGAQQGGGGELLCFPTQEQADTYNQTGQIQNPGEAYNPTTGQVVNPDAVPCDQVLRPEGAAGGPAPVAVEREFGTERAQECVAQREAQQQDPQQQDPGAGQEQYQNDMQPPATGGGMSGGDMGGMQELPSTGGPALLPLAGLMLIAGGALGFAGFRRRS